MNLITFFKTVSDYFNATERCGFCWSFKKVKGESGLNSLRLTDVDKCCVQIILTYERKNYSERYNFTTTGTTESYCDNQFTVYFVKTADIGTNYGDETPGHDDTESISNAIIQPLFGCLTCDNVMDLCELGYEFGIAQWSAEEVLFLGDQNFSGIKINGIFRVKI